MPYEKDENEIGALWKKTSATGMEFLSGTIDGIDVVCFPNKKQTSDRQPAYRVLKSKPRGGAPDRPMHNANAPKAVGGFRDVADEEIPF